MSREKCPRLPIIVGFPAAPRERLQPENEVVQYSLTQGAGTSECWVVEAVDKRLPSLRQEAIVKGDDGEWFRAKLFEVGELCIKGQFAKLSS